MLVQTYAWLYIHIHESDGTQDLFFDLQFNSVELTVGHTKVKDYRLPYYLPIAE